MALNATGVASAVAALVISGVTVKDLTQVPEQVYARDCPVLIPDPTDFMTNLQITRETFGADAVAFKQVRYSLHYTFFYKACGEERGLYAFYQDFVAKTTAILDALMANNTVGNCIDQYPESISLGKVVDPVGTEFHGVPIVLGILEWVNG